MPAVKWKPKAGTTWRDKLQREHPKHGTIVVARGRRMLIPRPLDVDAEVRRVRRGRVLTVGQLRARLADAGGAEVACPLCTGIFLRIVAEAAEEDRRAGRKRIAPYWRIVRDDGSMNPKYPGGGARQAASLRAEKVAIRNSRVATMEKL
jgi:alkylated DNA nucleotide flippase Atl1